MTPIFTLLIHPRYIILACDGLWDVCTKEEAVKSVDGWIESGKSTAEAASMLANYAYNHGSQDNITVIVIHIVWGPDPEVESSSIARSGIIGESRSSSRSSELVQQSIPPSLSSEPPLFLPTLVGVQLRGSYFYMGIHQNSFCSTKLGQNFPLPCWVCNLHDQF